MSRLSINEGRPGDFEGKKVSTEKAKRELGWVLKANFEEGVRRYVKWHQKETKTL
jgi:nucleoside-diphosphate-sugar epimerase